MTAIELIGAWQMDFYPQCGPLMALEFLNDANKIMIRSTSVRNSTSTVSLTSGTREYVIPSTILRILAAYYVRSSSDGDFYEVFPTSVDELDIREQGWRRNPLQGVPQRYYTTNRSGGIYLGFDQIPQTTTVTGYPNVTLYTSDYGATLGLQDSLPDVLLNFDFYRYDMCRNWALRKDPERVGYWEGLRDMALTQNVQHIQNLVENDAPGFIFGWITGGRFR